ncbi:MAG TPA: hypothetical protein VFZ78_04050, partial [Flavisolibacter sp.]
SDEYAVKGRQGILIRQKLSFGEFRTTQLKRSWTKGYTARTGFSTGGSQPGEWLNVISLEYINRKQTLHFSLTDGSYTSDVFCVTRFNASVLEIGPRPNSLPNILLDFFSPSENNFYIQLYAGAGEPWQLLLDNQASQLKAREYVGVMARGKDAYYTIHPVSRLNVNGKEGNMIAGSAGYEIRDAQGNIKAAVSTIDKGVVYLGRSTAEERFLLANLCAAILLQEQIG